MLDLLACVNCYQAKSSLTSSKSENNVAGVTESSTFNRDDLYDAASPDSHLADRQSRFCLSMCSN